MNNKTNKNSYDKNSKDNKYVTELTSVEEYAREKFIPVILHPMANFLCDLIITNKPKNILEIGTAIGYSGTLMLKNSPSAKLTTLDIDEERIKTAKENFQDFQVADRVTLLNIDAMAFIENYFANETSNQSTTTDEKIKIEAEETKNKDKNKEEIKENKYKKIKTEKEKAEGKEKEKFDFIFLDGPKGQYIKYLPFLKSILNKNGLLVADDINFLGKVFSDDYPIHKHRTFVVNLRKFVKEISEDKDFETTIYPIGESVIVARKIL